MSKLVEKLTQITNELCRQVAALDFEEPVQYVYNPLQYASNAYQKYLEMYAKKKSVLWVGMNPGPFGMAQTGVPFGDVNMVTSFLGITGKLKKLPPQHPKRPIDGFSCSRSEVSGTRLWGYAREQYGSPKAFFEKFFVLNYCPLVFMGASGKNITPDKLSKSKRDELFLICDHALYQFVIAMEVPFVVGIGAFARGVCQRALADSNVEVGQILHPSPASPAANRGWASAVHQQLLEMELL